MVIPQMDRGVTSQTFPQCESLVPVQLTIVTYFCLQYHSFAQVNFLTFLLALSYTQLISPTSFPLDGFDSLNNIVRL